MQANKIKCLLHRSNKFKLKSRTFKKANKSWSKKLMSAIITNPDLKLLRANKVVAS